MWERRGGPDSERQRCRRPPNIQGGSFNEPQVIVYDTPKNLKVEEVPDGLQYLADGDAEMRDPMKANRVCFCTRRERRNTVLEVHPRLFGWHSGWMVHMSLLWMA